MNLILHSPNSQCNLSAHYRRAFKNAIELFIVTAYLTEWDSSLKLRSDCKTFRLIIGKDFGITRKEACKVAMRWLPSRKKWQFMVTDQIAGFHPKAVFWREANQRTFAIIGSSNLTNAAFERNYEANYYCEISEENYCSAKQWIKQIEKQSIGVSDDWLKKYKEARPADRQGLKKSKSKGQDSVPLIPFTLPNHRESKEQIKCRRKQLAAHKEKKAELIKLFRRCANGKITSQEFYSELPIHWSWDVGNRFQSMGSWERTGRNSNFQQLAQSFIRILKASDGDRDDVIAEEIDQLHEDHVPTRGAFLSEMLCLQYPQEYPVLNGPVRKYLRTTKFKPPRGASEGARYIDMAKKLRFSLLQNPNHPAKNLAELDTVIWLKYSKKK
ncbi:MAG: NgoFVII family restriction endonuclease [Desulfobacteraceae bacterium]|nr:NgoFVII family restriction endonuclease [Desulfobacteraceae bacterium]